MTLQNAFAVDAVAGAPTYSGKNFRLFLDDWINLPGVFDPADFTVAEQASPNNTVQVAAGAIGIVATGAGLAGKFYVANDAAANSPTISPTSGNGRKDRLIVRVNGTTGIPALEVVQGVASGSPAEPPITGDNFEELALITLPASTSNITNAMITDRRRPAFRAMFGYGTAAMLARHTSSLIKGLSYYDTTNNRKLEYQTATTGWTLPWGMGWGVLTSGITTGTAAIALGTGGAETVGKTSSSITIVANRILRIDGVCRLTGAGGFYGKGRIRRGTTTGGTLIGGPYETSPANNGFGAIASVPATGIESGLAAGAYQWVYTAEAADLTNPAFISVQDLGPSAAPA